MSLQNLMSLKKRRALVTGATGHLGKVICETLAEMGAELYLVDLPGSKFQGLQKKLKQKWKTECHAFPCNLEKEQERTILIQSIRKKTSNLSILVNNAAFVGNLSIAGWAVPFAKQNLVSWRRALEVNLTTVFQLCQGFAPLLKNAKGANILNIGSIYAEVGPDWGLYRGTKMGNPAAYAVSKGGLVQLTRWLATTLSPTIRVNAISPGGILRKQHPDFVKRYEKKTPLGKMANENDFRGAVAFFSSNLSSYCTGQNLIIDGGWTIW